MADKYRVIKTFLRGQIYHDILDSVLGQMSDGIWENSNIYGYWVSVEISDNNDIIVSKSRYVEFCNSYYKNGFYDKSDSEVKKYFANKIKTVVNVEQKDYPKRNLRWSNTNNTPLIYIRPYEGKPQYMPYKSNLGNTWATDKYGKITVADCWNAYQILMMDSQRPKVKKSATPIANRTLNTPKSHYLVTDKVYANSMKFMKKR